MKKNTFILLGAILAAVLLAACGGAQPAAPAPAQQAAQPVQAAPPASDGAAYAPFCAAGSVCAAPAVGDTDPINTYCVEKIPYQNLSLDPGVVFESLDPSGELRCYDSGTVVDGKHIITCTGKQLWKYQLQLTGAGCGGAALAAGTGQCPEGYGYDAAGGCCSPLGGGTGGSTVITINMGACPSK